MHNAGDDPLTSPQQRDLAKYMGWQKTDYRSHGQAVYTDGKSFYSYDVDSHNGGVWKKADSVENLGKKATRLGTYDYTGKTWVHC